jgi:hypothetical protein
MGMKTEKYNCSTCEAELETTAAGIAAHRKKCAKARQWQRDYFREKGRWPNRNSKSVLQARKAPSARRAGREPGFTFYDD